MLTQKEDPTQALEMNIHGLKDVLTWNTHLCMYTLTHIATFSVDCSKCFNKCNQTTLNHSWRSVCLKGSKVIFTKTCKNNLCNMKRTKCNAAINTLHFICDSRNWFTEYAVAFCPKPPLISDPPVPHFS